VVQRCTPQGRPFVTDGGHYLLDASLGRIPDPEALAAQLAEIPGVVEHGLFIGLASAAILAGPEGVRIVEARIQSRAHRIACESSKKDNPL
jgi:ribose 5-phosphate isomerase A